MVVAYNQENLIRETIGSILAQNYSNLEIVISDDASTDNTPAIIKEYQKKYPEIIIPVLNSKNLGITGNSNTAFFACTGDLIAIMGGDDIYLPEKLHKQVKAFEDESVVLSYHPVDVFLHQTGESLFITNQTESERINDVYEIITKGGIPGASSIMVRKSACPEHGFDPEFPTVSDWIFSIEVAYMGKVVEIPSVLGRYRKHGEGASERTFELLNESLLTLTKIRLKYPNDEYLEGVCRSGRYRYLCGELFRQIENGNHTLANDVKKMIECYVPENKRRQWFVLSFFVSKNSIFKLSHYVLPKLKNIIKRII
ncbi:glycosyltransferase family 2 protein [Vibrio sp. F74]|uniref:glycosyltransferase family 2 protein n=1 Tax=Vibrio sp. F74 TaxID=700020 RepID=UPI0035F57D78